MEGSGLRAQGSGLRAASAVMVDGRDMMCVCDGLPIDTMVMVED